MNRYYQEGGEVDQLMQLFQIFADVVQDDEFSTAEEVMQMFQQLSPEEQQAFVQQAMQIVQSIEEESENEFEENEFEEESIPELEEEPTMQLGGYVNNTGYLEGYDTNTNHYNIIPSNKISMKNVRPDIKYIKGTDNLGNIQYMEHGGEYKFDGDFVLEEPVYAQNGTGVSDLTKQLQQVEISLNQQKKERELQLQKLSKEKQTSESKIKIARVKELYDRELGKINSLKDNIRLGLPFILKNPNDPNLELKLKNYKDALKDLDSKTKNLNKLNPDNFDYTNNRAVPKKESGIIFSDFSFGYPKNIEYIDSFSKNKPTNNNSQEILQVRGKNKTYNLTPIDDTNYKDNEGRTWSKQSNGAVVVTKDVDKSIQQQNSILKLNQDKLKTQPLSKKINKAVAEKIATPQVLIPPAVPTETFENQFEIPLMDEGNYYIPEEQRETNLNPNAFNRTNIGVGRKFFKQQGGNNYMQRAGYVAPKFKQIDLGLDPRLNPNYDMNVGEESNTDFYIPDNYKTKLYPMSNSNELEFDMGKTSPIGNFTQKMFEGRSSNELLDLGNYANRFGLDNLGLQTTYGDNTESSTNTNTEKKSRFQEFMDKYGKKSDLTFNPNQRSLAAEYNLMKASEPLVNQYRPNINLKYAETPMLDPLPGIQQLYNQQRLTAQNVNTNSPTGQAYLSNINSQTQQKTIELLNDVQQKNAQIAAQNEQARVASYNQEQQLNIAANQQYLQNQMLAQAQKDEMEGSSLSDLDKLNAGARESRNRFKALTLLTPGLKESNTLGNAITGTQGFDIDKDYQKLYYSLASAKTPEEREAIFKATQAALKRNQEAAKETTKQAQTGGSINQFFKKRIS